MVHKILFASFSTHSDIDAANITRQEIKKTENRKRALLSSVRFEKGETNERIHSHLDTNKRMSERTRALARATIQ